MTWSTAAAVPSRAAPAASAADERRSAATASVALYGFVAWIGTHIAFVLFVLWAYLPERVLHRLGVLYYPSQYWALALPCHLMVSVAALYAAYWIYNLSRLPPLDGVVLSAFLKTWIVPFHEPTASRASDGANASAQM